MNPLAIFKSGCHQPTSGPTLCFSDSDLQATVNAYAPHRHEAPIVIGHPATDDPAYGWVERLNYQNGVLLAAPKQIDPAFASDVQAGRYKKISAAFFPPNHPRNPRPGVYYLRHVGFLGAAEPAVKGLSSAAFSGTQHGLVTFAAMPIEPEPCSFTAPEGFAVDPERLAEYQRILAYQAQHPGISFVQACTAVENQTFIAPAGYTVDPDRLALHQRILAYQAAHPGVEFAQACAALEKETTYG